MRFRLKITLCMLCILALLFGFGGNALISLSFDTALEREKEAALGSYVMLLNTLQVVSGTGVWQDVQDLSDALSQLLAQNASSWRVLRLRSESDVIFLSRRDMKLPDDDYEYAEPESCRLSFFQDEAGGYFLQLTGSIKMKNESFYLDAVEDISGIYATREQQLEVFGEVYIILVVVCAVLTYTIAWFLTRPLRRLTRASKQIAAGDLSYRSNVRGGDEIGTLAREFDNMAEQMEGYVGELERAMERQERFMASFTHELKTPMASMIGYADLLRSQILSPEEQQEAASYIFSESRRLAGLSQKLLEIIVTDKQELDLKPVSPSVLIRRVLETSMPGIGREIQIDCNCQPGTCLMDADLVASLVFNLVENARKALDGRGKIQVNSRMTDEGCVISVSDNGKGISEEALAHITEEFYREDKSRSREQGGAGLGLTLCLKIARLHGGSLYFESSLGEGTVVTAELKGGRV